MEQRDWIEPEWPAPPHVRALITTRRGGVSEGVFASMNLGASSGDKNVDANRALLRAFLPAEPVWLLQMHGDRVVEAKHTPRIPEADASFSRSPGVVCAVLTADCLPVFLCDGQGTMVAAAHAGWRGLASGILTRAVEALPTSPLELMAYLGPAIGTQAFEVGADVRQAFINVWSVCDEAFTPHGKKWLANLYQLARLQLAAAGVTRVNGGGLCTFTDRDRFFSHRRDGVTGRMASLIWLEHSGSAARL
jgi:YfiH family protein